jgi:hypothetical protein
MALIDGLLQELEEEARTTRRVLEQVPDGELTGDRTKRRCTCGRSASEYLQSMNPARTRTRLSEARHLDGAIDIASQIPGAHVRTAEVRPRADKREEVRRS